MAQPPPSPRPTSGPSTNRWLSPALALALIVAGTRLLVLHLAGSSLPYYDQWLAEFNNTFLLAASGEGLSSLLLRHNEHILLTTKLVSLAGFLANGYWDVVFLAVCSAGVRALVAAWTFRLLAAGLPRAQLLIWLACAFIFVLPFSAYNWLNGMQVSFYFADLAVLWSLHVTLHWKTPLRSGPWLVLATAAGLLSFASAIAIPAATLAAHLVQRRPRPGFWAAWAASAALAGGYILMVAQGTPGEDAAPIQSPVNIVLSFLQLASWPILSPIAGAVVVGLFVVIWRQPSTRAGTGAIAGLAAFAAINALLLAARRPPAEIHMRHWETAAFIPLVLVTLGILGGATVGQPPLLATRITAALVVVYGVAALNLLQFTSLPYYTDARQARATTVAHYRAMLLSEEKLQLEGDRINGLLRDGDRTFFDHPLDRFALHPVVVQNLLHFRPSAQALLSPEIFPVREPSGFSQVVHAIRDFGWLLAAGGAVLGFAGIRRTLRAPAPA